MKTEYIYKYFIPFLFIFLTVRYYYSMDSKSEVTQVPKYPMLYHEVVGDLEAEPVSLTIKSEVKENVIYNTFSYKGEKPTDKADMIIRDEQFQIQSGSSKVKRKTFTEKDIVYQKNCYVFIQIKNYSSVKMFVPLYEVLKRR